MINLNFNLKIDTFYWHENTQLILPKQTNVNETKAIKVNNV